MGNVASKREAFRRLHDGSCFLLPNPWDIGSTKRLEAAGFPALATSSAAAAWALGKQDYEITAEDALVHCALIAGATDLPVNADFENGFSNEPEEVAENVERVVRTGIAGLSIEDRARGNDLRDLDNAVACVRAAKFACGDALLVARCEAYLVGRNDLGFTIERLQAFAEAGADCLYAPGVTDPTDIARIVEAVAPLPVNVLLYGGLTARAAADAGARRISLGGALAWKAWTAFDAAAAEFATSLD
ncbi:2-methylisocitrate lyase [Sphingomonas antarctica]|uniref:isocitrate lyase/PEP mutase family protein n=1 Tax=Sphingomonas antarctica TaxID=2040274 RepID=UPI0039E99A12